MSDSYETTRSSAPGYPDARDVDGHLVIELEEWVPGPAPRDRYDVQTGTWDRFVRCIRCETDVPHERHLPESCYTPAFARGDRVIDKQNPSLAVVIYPDVGRADRHRIEGTTVAEYDTNTEYPNDDPVVRVAFMDWLDAYVPGWREWESRKLSYNLGEYARDYGIDIRHYDYPESRLKPVEQRNIGVQRVAADGGDP